MFNFFKKKEKETNTETDLNFSSVVTDMHSHLIPGLDDGAQNMEESIVLIKRMMDLGFKKLITTPHVMSDYFQNTTGGILDGLEALRAELVKKNINIEIDAAAEYLLDESFGPRLDRGDILSIGGKYVLFELSFINYPHNLFEIIEKIKKTGYTPILAHPERYLYMSVSKNYQQIRESGCLLQLNVLSLIGYYGKQSKILAEEMVDAGLVDLVGSDLHKVRHADALKKALAQPYVARLLTDFPLKNPLI